MQPQDALLRMDAAALSVEQLAVLSRAVPDDQVGGRAGGQGPCACRFVALDCRPCPFLLTSHMPPPSI